MIQLGSKYIELNIEQVIDVLQKEMDKRFNRLYFRNVKRTGDNLMLTCPFHTNGAERKPSLGINIHTGLFNCFTCHESGSIDVFVSKCFRYEDNGEYGRKWLLDLFSDNIYENRQGLQLQERKVYVPPKYVTEEELDNYRWYHKYMWKRRLTPELVEFFDIGYDSNTDCITIPVNDLSGNCVFIARRSVKGKFFNYPKDVDKPIFGLDKCYNAKTIFICESVFNATTIWSYGLKAVALLGTGSKYQYDILSKCGVRKFYLCFDGDNAGKRGAERFIKNVKTNANIVVVEMLEGKDVNDISEQQFFELVTLSDERYMKESR